MQTNSNLVRFTKKEENFVRQDKKRDKDSNKERYKRNRNHKMKGRWDE